MFPHRPVMSSLWAYEQRPPSQPRCNAVDMSSDPTYPGHLCQVCRAHANSVSCIPSSGIDPEKDSKIRAEIQKRVDNKTPEWSIVRYVTKELEEETDEVKQQWVIYISNLLKKTEPEEKVYSDQMSQEVLETRLHTQRRIIWRLVCKLLTKQVYIEGHKRTIDRFKRNLESEKQGSTLLRQGWQQFYDKFKKDEYRLQQNITRNGAERWHFHEEIAKLQEEIRKLQNENRELRATLKDCNHTLWDINKTPA